MLACMFAVLADLRSGYNSQLVDENRLFQEGSWVSKIALSKRGMLNYVINILYNLGVHVYTCTMV